MEFVKKVEASQQTCDSCPEFQEHFPVVPVSRDVKTIRCSSQLEEEKFSYTWKIFDFYKIPFICCYPIYSPTFYINPKHCRWQIVMTKHAFLHEDCNDEGDYISGSEEEDSDADDSSKKEVVKTKRIGFRLAKFENTSKVWDTVRYSFTVKTSDGTTVSTVEREDPGVPNYKHSPKASRYAFLTEKEFGEVNLFDEKYLEVTCNINYGYIEGSTRQSPVAYEGKRFVEDLRVLYENNRYFDMLLKVNGEAHDNAHKIVLRAAIPGFENILEEQDQPKGKFDLKLDSEVAKAMVNFIYSGKIDSFPLEKCIDLHEAAKRYGVDCLQEYCSDYFKNNLASETCKECLGITEGLVDCLKSIKKLGVEKVKKILANEACSHKNKQK